MCSNISRQLKIQLKLFLDLERILDILFGNFANRKVKKHKMCVMSSSKFAGAGNESATKVQSCMKIK